MTLEIYIQGHAAKVIADEIQVSIRPYSSRTSPGATVIHGSVGVPDTCFIDRYIMDSALV